MNSAYEKAAQRHIEGCYRNEDDGLYYCGICNEPKQREHKANGENTIIPRNCRCDRDRLEKENQEKEELRHRNAVKEIQRRGIYDNNYLKNTMAKDDQKNPEFSALCQKYIDQWNTAQARNIGLIFTGDTGTGKTFMAAAIGNELIEKREAMVVMIKLSHAIRIMRANDDSTEKLIRDINRADLFILDEYGGQIGTDYVEEQTTEILDVRANAEKPTIITTNIKREAFNKPENEVQARQFDRIRKMCSFYQTVGESRRQTIAEDKKQILKEDILK